MDYDLTNIPEGYDRGRDHGPELTDLWMKVIAGLLNGAPVNTILDLGCGTGRFTEALATWFDAQAIGIDPSKKMLERARAKQHSDQVQYYEGSAEAVPLQAGSVDLIFMSMSFHHFNDASLAARECHRVLRADGIVFVRTGTFERIPMYPYVPFFPNVMPILIDVLPTTTELRDVFENAGFRLVASETITQTIAPGWDAYAEKLSAGGDSVLARLSEQELKTGLDAMRQRADDEAAKTIVEPIDLLVFRVEQ